MIVPPPPPNEEQRLKALHALKLLDTEPEERFDRICRLACETFDTPVAYVSLIAEERQWYKASCGLGGLTETPRSLSFCAFTILADDAVVVADTHDDARFQDHPFVLGDPKVRFYLGYPLSTLDGHKVGTFCIMDFRPRASVDDGLVDRLRDIAFIAQTELNLLDSLHLQKQLMEQSEQLQKHNDFIRRVFGRYVTPEVAGMVLAHPEGLKIGGSRRKVTVLMSDLRGFTDMSERISPEVVVSLLNRYLERMVAVIEKYEGTIDEIIGDALLVIFGAPLVLSDAAGRAVACAIEMQQAMDEFNDESEKLGAPRVSMGIGVNTGEVVVGNIGCDRRAKYGVVGSPVNMTARIESFTVGGQILASEATVKELAGRLRVDGQLRVKMKGFDGATTIYDLGGITAPYNVSLPVLANALTEV